MKLVLAVLAFVGAMPQAAQSTTKCSSIESKPLCSLLMEATQHDNSNVTVRGLYLKMPHGMVLTTEECPGLSRDTVSLTTSTMFFVNKQTWKTLSLLTRRRKPAEVVLTGRFHVAAQGQVFGQGNELYEIELVSILCAEPYAPVRRTPSAH